MPKLNMETTHTLGREEAVRRLKEKFSFAKGQFGGSVNDLQEEWNDSTLSFGFTAVGMKVDGTVAVDDKTVKLDANIPLAAMMFKGTIEERIRQEMADVFA